MALNGPGLSKDLNLRRDTTAWPGRGRADEKEREMGGVTGPLAYTSPGQWGEEGKEVRG